MRKLIELGVGFIVIAAALMIGAGVISQAYSVVNQTAPSTLLTNVFTQGSQALTTLTSFLPIVAIAVVGGIALFYLITYLGGGGQNKVG